MISHNGPACFLREQAKKIYEYAIRSCMPGEAVRRALEALPPPCGRRLLVAAGKAAWEMAHAACSILSPDAGIVITKDGHAKGPVGNLEIYEAAHPVPDERGFNAAERALRICSELSERDEVIFLLSGGASALFEVPLVSKEELFRITEQLLAGGAAIGEINAVRKGLSAVKGGRFALHCAPAKVFSVILSDVLGDRVDIIGSGPTVPDMSLHGEALRTAEKYGIELSDEAKGLLERTPVRELQNSTVCITGSVRLLADAAERACRELGYDVVRLGDSFDCEASELGRMLGRLAAENEGSGKAFIAAGETTVHVRGKGKGGRNQEIALSAAELIRGKSVCVFSVGSDGTDGPTDAAGGFTCGESAAMIGDTAAFLLENDSYNALLRAGGLIVTGPTGTNVNDVSVALCPKN